MSLTDLKTLTTRVICLRTYDYSEADKIVHFYDRTRGRLSSIAKGVKKTKSKLAGACEPLSVSRVQLTEGKEIHRLCQYEPQETFPGIRADLLKLAYGLLYLELVHLQQDNTDSTIIFDLLLQNLQALEETDSSFVTLTGLTFQLQLLHATGIKPTLTHCVLSSLPLSEEPYYCFSPQLGGITTVAKKSIYQGKHIHEDWVYISLSTCKLFQAHIPLQEHLNTLTLKERLKAQRFLQYYTQKVYERRITSYDLLLNLLE